MKMARISGHSQSHRLTGRKPFSVNSRTIPQSTASCSDSICCTFYYCAFFETARHHVPIAVVDSYNFILQTLQTRNLQYRTVRRTPRQLQVNILHLSLQPHVSRFSEAPTRSISLSSSLLRLPATNLLLYGRDMKCDLRPSATHLRFYASHLIDVCDRNVFSLPGRSPPANRSWHWL